MNKYFYSDKIEAYILNNLPESERIAFEELIEQDPILKSELALQKETIGSLQEQRKAQLKQRLNNIKVEPVSYSLSRITLLESALLVSIIATTITLFALLYSTKSNLIAENIAPSNYRSELSFASYTKVASKPIHKPKEEIKKLSSISQFKTSKNDYQNTLLDRIEKDQARKPVVREEKLPTEVLPKSNESGGSPAAVPQSKQIVYQYYNGKLFLQNKESRALQIPLVINGVTKLYLYYEGKVYELKPNQVEPVTPKQVTDSKIIERVKNHKQLFFGN
ncbi:hypothetical protein BKI52_16850 [marine bacterium AO1-C]|nr:hypothetical protein BKI52_16850 [marine bacterium AO1-C]